MSTIRRFKILKRGVFLAAAVAVMAFGPAPAEAAVVSFLTPAGATAGGQPVSARADFTTADGSVMIILTNLLANPTAVVQAISDFFFTVANGNVTGSSQTSASGQEITVNSNGTITLGPVLNTVAAVDWAYSSTATTGLLNVLGPGAAGPEHLIIGPPGPGGIYSNASGSIAGNNAHNPFLNQVASFTITAPDVTAATTISSAVFSFGTTAGINVPGVPVPTAIPEPASFATVGMGTLLGLGYALRKRKRAVA